MRAESNPGHPRVIALFTSDEIFALDIEQAVTSIGFKALTEKTYEVLRLEGAERERIEAGIVDMHMGGERSQSCLGWLTSQGIPTFLVSMEEDPPEEVRTFPGVIAHYSKPFWVEHLLDAIMALGRGRPAAS